jgi:ABC-type sugar transport system substrate-binding protein
MKKKRIIIKTGLVFLIGAFAVFMIGAKPKEKPGEKKELHKLTRDDILEIYQPGNVMKYKDMYMDEAVETATLADLELTEEEKEKIRAMNLKIAMEWEAMNDPSRWKLAAATEVCEDLGIEIVDVWVATKTTGMHQMDDYLRIEGLAEKYDAFFTLPIDLAATSEVLKRIMEKTHVGFFCSKPFGIDWNHPNFVGVSDADGYLAGVYSAEASAKIINYEGVIGTIGWKGAREGAFHTCETRYIGWDDTFAKYENIEVYEKWYDAPEDTEELVTSLLAAHPDMDLLLIDFANPPADQAQTIVKERGLEAWEDISIVTIDLDDTITVPMALDGPDDNYVSAFITQMWYKVGANTIKLYAKHVLYGNDAPKFIATPPLPVTVWENLKTHYLAAVPEDWETPQEVLDLTNQWDVDIEWQWD